MSDDGSSALVCYTNGCTAARTPLSTLKLLEADKVPTEHRDKGFHRFDDSCPNFDADVCMPFCPEKAERG